MPAQSGPYHLSDKLLEQLKKLEEIKYMKQKLHGFKISISVVIDKNVLARNLCYVLYISALC